MSRAFQCDRCGDFYKAKKFVVGDIRCNLGLAVKLENGKVRGRMLDLCPRCESKLMMFAMGIPDEEDIYLEDE